MKKLSILAAGLWFLSACAAARPKECSRIHLISDPELEQTAAAYLETAWDLTKHVAQKTRSLLEKGYARYHSGR